MTGRLKKACDEFGTAIQAANAALKELQDAPPDSPPATLAQLEKNVRDHISTLRAQLSQFERLLAPAS